MIVKTAKLEVSRRLAKKKLEKLKNQKGGDPQDKTQYPVGRGRGQPPRQGQQAGRPPLTPTAPPMPVQQAPQPTTTRGRCHTSQGNIPAAPLTPIAQLCQLLPVSMARNKETF